MCCNNKGLFGGNSCTWVLILVIIFLLVKQNDCGRDYDDCGCNNTTTSYNNGCGCGCC